MPTILKETWVLLAKFISQFQHVHAQHGLIQTNAVKVSIQLLQVYSPGLAYHLAVIQNKCVRELGLAQFNLKRQSEDTLKT